MTRRGATGMNTAILSGHDLGWKLAWVHRGWAGDELLDTYEAERRPVAEHNLARSVDPNGSLRAASEGLHVDLGGRIPHVWLPDGRSTLGLLGPGLTAFTGPGGRRTETARGRGWRSERWTRLRRDRSVSGRVGRCSCGPMPCRCEANVTGGW
jgi:2-polyprenyl-6-methoxyphenol hydroxylase-like FAD-dependent oxidoreductase